MFQDIPSAIRTTAYDVLEFGSSGISHVGDPLFLMGFNKESFETFTGISPVEGLWLCVDPASEKQNADGQTELADLNPYMRIYVKPNPELPKKTDLVDSFLSKVFNRKFIPNVLYLQSVYGIASIKESEKIINFSEEKDWFFYHRAYVSGRIYRFKLAANPRNCQEVTNTSRPHFLFRLTISGYFSEEEFHESGIVS